MPYEGKFQVFEDIIQEMMVVYQHDRRPWLIGYSGGKDSTLLVSIAYEAITRLPPEARTKKSISSLISLTVKLNLSAPVWHESLSPYLWKTAKMISIIGLNAHGNFLPSNFGKIFAFTEMMCCSTKRKRAISRVTLCS